MTSNNFIKSLFLFISLFSMVFGISCSNDNMVGSANVKTVAPAVNNVCNVEVSFDSLESDSRSWSIATYKVKATCGDITVEGESTSATVTLALTAGTWAFVGSAYDSTGLLIYKGAFTTEISTTNKSVEIIMIKKSGNLNINISAYSVNNSDITSVKLVASKNTFDSVTQTVSSFAEEASFTGLASGEWSVEVIGISSTGSRTLGTEKCEVVADAVVNVISSGSQLLTTATPSITPASGTYEVSQNVRISCTEENAVIYYTTDGTTPTVNSTRYTGEFIYLYESATIKAIAAASGKNVSEVATSVIIIQPKQDIKDKIILHVKGYTSLWAWNKDNPSENYTGGTWPGVTMEDEGNGWYTYTIKKNASMVIFSYNGGSQTGDLEIGEGEWWYDEGTFKDTNPNDSVAPVLSTFTADKTNNATGNVKFSASATDNLSLKKVEIVANGASIGSIKMSGTSGNGTFTWDTTAVPNGSYEIVATAYDAANNASATKTVTVKTANTFSAKAVISGASRAVVSSTKAFNGSSSSYLGGTITNYAWTVTGGATLSSSTGVSVNVTFPNSETTVTVTLTITTSDGKTATATQSVTVVPQNATSGDFREETIYFLMTTRFFDGDSSNNEYCWDEGGEYLPFGAGDCAWRGDFKGLAEKLDYIKALGFSAIWITPVVQNASGIDYHGYHAYDFKTVDPRYESSNFKYQDLIDACHNKGIKVIQDIVLNHTGNFGEKNIFGMFKKDTVAYTNKDYPLPSDSSSVAPRGRSPFYSVDPNGYAYNKLMAGLAMTGQSGTYDSVAGPFQYAARINAMKEDSIDTDFRYHHAKMIDWNSENCQLGQMAGDCVDLNTENPTVFNYLKDAYCSYIEMGVDAFRIDTVKHISRLTFNKEFIPAFMEAGGENFYIFGETCARYRGRWNEGVPALSPAFYTWKEDQDFAWSPTDHATNSASATTHFGTYRGDYAHPAWVDGTANHLLKNGRTYHEPDYSMRSHLDQIDFPMHWAFRDAGEAFNTAVNCNDPDFNDATWNVTYVDSHDYAPDNAPEGQRFNGYWPDKMNLLWTFRGIPCIYYGSEIEFMKGAPIDPANARCQLNKSGRAYFGDHIEGSVDVSGYGKYSNASGAMAETLNHPLAQHVRRLNLIRRAVRALQKGQYSVEGCSGNIAFKRGYKNPDDSEFSFACVAINGGATFNNLPGGTYTEVITGATKTVSDGGSIASDSIGEGNMRVYVLQPSDQPGKIGQDGQYLK